MTPIDRWTPSMRAASVTPELPSSSWMGLPSAPSPALPTGDCASVRVESPDPKSWVSMALVSDREGRPSSEGVLGYRAVLQKIKLGNTIMLQESRCARTCVVAARTKAFEERILSMPNVAVTKGARPLPPCTGPFVPNGSAPGTGRLGGTGLVPLKQWGRPYRRGHRCPVRWNAPLAGADGQWGRPGPTRSPGKPLERRRAPPERARRTPG